MNQSSGQEELRIAVKEPGTIPVKYRRGISEKK